MAKPKGRKKVVKSVVKAAPKKASRKPAAKAAKSRATQPVQAADIRLPLTAPVRTGPRRRPALFLRELPLQRGKE